MTLSVMENQDTYRSALREYQSNLGDIPKILERYLEFVARTGRPLFSWELISELIIRKFENIVDSYENEKITPFRTTIGRNDICSIEEIRTECVSILRQISGVPFTIQRICELLLFPKQYYSKVEKFLRGFLRVIKVVTIVDRKGDKITTESQKLANCLSPTLSGMGGINETGDGFMPLSMSTLSNDQNIDDLSNHNNSSTDEEYNKMSTNETSQLAPHDGNKDEMQCDESEFNLNSLSTHKECSSNQENNSTEHQSYFHLQSTPNPNQSSSSQDQTSISMPPIRALLKPIDELEAFVQQVPTQCSKSSEMTVALSRHDVDDENDDDDDVNDEEDDECEMQHDNDHIPPMKRRKIDSTNSTFANTTSTNNNSSSNTNNINKDTEIPNEVSSTTEEDEDKLIDKENTEKEMETSDKLEKEANNNNDELLSQSDDSKINELNDFKIKESTESKESVDQSNHLKVINESNESNLNESNDSKINNESDENKSNKSEIDKNK